MISNKNIYAFEAHRQVLSLKKRQMMTKYKSNEKIKFNLLKKTVYKKFDSKKIITNLKDKVNIIHTNVGKKISTKHGERK